MFVSVLVIAILSFSTRSLAWGALGHETVAHIAEHFVTPDTKAFCQRILGNRSDGYLAGIATCDNAWSETRAALTDNLTTTCRADSYRRQKGGEFSAPFHFIDAEDSPPTACNVDYERDCASEGCVISALNNYTRRVTDKTLPAEERNHALRFIVHLIGDAHQYVNFPRATPSLRSSTSCSRHVTCSHPAGSSLTIPLHNEAIAVGGNLINVTFDGETTNLHAAWDTSIPEKMNGGENESDALTWSRNLAQAIESGIFQDDKAEWLSGMNINDTITSALIWAHDANAFVCSAVIPGGIEAVEHMDLGTAYYQSVIDTVELQIARAGYRLAAWLNLIATGQLGLQKAENASVRTLSKPAYFRARNFHSSAKLARREFGHDCHCG